MIKKDKSFFAITTLLILLIFISIIIIILIFKINRTDNKKHEESESYSSYQEEKNIELAEKDISLSTLNILLKCINTSSTDYTFIKEIYFQTNDFINVYAVYGVKNNEMIYYIVTLDYYNYTYDIKSVSEEECNKVKEGKINDYIKITKIEENNNKFELISMSDVQISLMYFNIIKNLFNSEPEVLYDLLDTEYKQKRFETIENFVQYVNMNKNKFANMEISRYAKYKYDDYTQYVCLDNNEDYYIINYNVNNGEYKIFLDTYTVDQPEFIEKYEKATDEQKAGYNINKFIQAINNKDYNYAYNCLADSFKQNNFNTLNDFENYIKNNFANNNELEYLKAYQEGQYYVYDTNIMNKDDSSIIGQKNFIVNLKEDRKFELSFSI